MVSLTGAVNFKKVTKLYKGKFKFCRNELKNAMIIACLIVRLTSQTRICIKSVIVIQLF